MVSCKLASRAVVEVRVSRPPPAGHHQVSQPSTPPHLGPSSLSFMHLPFLPYTYRQTSRHPHVLYKGNRFQFDTHSPFFLFFLSFLLFVLQLHHKTNPLLLLCKKCFHSSSHCEFALMEVRLHAFPRLS
ncbi:hypothetical protein ES332_D02G234600v1 [Gossypium tomentosum]|uniref:Uncharacterized protein n=1 Tax=Gossypium tomentosum TaxID=34277 RepID=A0A5D2M127_GOSTO|nr:hypothetical protein ES332_D02G234600v1 [Gossypium tomentosum]